ETASQFLERTPIVDFSQRISKRLEANELILHRSRDHPLSQFPELDAAGNDVGVGKGQQHEQTTGQFLRYGDLKMQTAGLQEGSGQQNGEQSSSRQDPGGSHNQPQLPIALLQLSEFQIDIGQNVVGIMATVCGFF